MVISPDKGLNPLSVAEYMMTDIKEFVSTFNKITINKSDEAVFSDFLDISICALSAGKYEEEYLSIIKRYRKEEVELFCELFARMVLIMDNEGTGLTDCLGEFYQNHISIGKHGQFFTPEHVCDAMAAMLIGKEDRNKTVYDPCCGSGRMLLSAAKIARHNYFFAADIDERCAKMAAINFCLNGLCGEVAHMDSLGGEHWGGYAIRHAYGLVPIISKLPAREGILYNMSPFHGTKEAEPQSAETKVITVTQAKLDFE